MVATITPAEIYTPPRHRFTPEEHLRLFEIGFFGPEDRIELIEGDLIDLAAMDWRHGNTVTRPNRLLAPLAGDLLLQVQCTVAIGDNRPQPDFALLRIDLNMTRLPNASEVMLAIEVADSSIRYDRETKRRIYAAAGIPEYWIADLTTDTIVMHSDPTPTGYRLIKIVGRGKRAQSATLPHIDIAVDDALAAPLPLDEEI